ncbi:hypothetical protein EZV62_003339 [Acer yangbiense]|uniref:CN hydrolase domain-containing protein n=1 Tax=Acer yangbiense TaxID=1000413 RepID=A0A5C7IHG7_9ROSI|nr:hypothetical protein EZV62_003339 [Acer yangbiense]
MMMATSSNSMVVNTSFDALSPLKMPTISKFKVGLCQLSVTLDKNQNLMHAKNSIKVAAEQGAKLVVLPEMWNCPYSNDYFAKYAEDFDDKDASLSFSLLSEAASCHGITIVGGSMPEWNNGQLYNTCVFGPDGKLKAKHRKDTFIAGDEPTIVETEMGCIGVGICHDMRFPELALLYRAKGAHMICYPGAFNMSTGELLWELVQRARAADNQIFVATCSPSRDSTGFYKIWGHSSLVAPSGEMIATSGCEETVLVAEIDYSAIELQRHNIPLERQCRRDVYEFIDISEAEP